MSLQWFRVDTTLPQHDKIISLVLEDTSTLRWRAAFAYVCAIAWSVNTGTDGRIPNGILPMVHANKPVAELLVKHHLWETDVAGYQIHNFAHYQQTTRVTEEKAQMGLRAACIRWHGINCWTPNGGCSRAT